MTDKYKDRSSRFSREVNPWKAALYIRLSKEDAEKKNESASVTNQREILLEYLRLHPEMELADIYLDDGYSGTDFDRPGWSRLMQDIAQRGINCVIVKDLARLGRNYTLSGDLIDNQFARMGVRFIALNNGIDTAGDGMNAAARCISIGVTNVINESYAASTSVNIRGTLNNHRLQGKFIGAFASYGYKKDPGDCHRLIIDRDAASVVRMIFDDFIGGRSILGITKKLNLLKIPNPTLYKRQKGFNFNSRTENDGLWSDRTVRRFLQNRMYIGDMVQGVNRKVNYKVHECRAVPRDEWIIVEHTHEPIIDSETFEKAQSLFARNFHSGRNTGEADLFAGFLYCADCGKAMHKKVNRQNGKIYCYYKCATKQKKSPEACTNHTVRTDRLKAAVISYIRMMAEVARQYKNQAAANRVEKSKAELICQAIELHKKEREKNLQTAAELYPDWKNGMITQNEYLQIRADLNKKLENLDMKIKNLKIEKARLECEAQSGSAFAKRFMDFKGAETLTRPMLVGLIDKILIRENGAFTVKLRDFEAFEAVIEKLTDYYATQNKSVLPPQ